MAKAFFVSGTDTDVGKTTAAAALLHAAACQGLSTAAVKPVASGCIRENQALRNSDAMTLWAQCTLPLSYAEINPFAFEPAIAPHLAAAEAGVELAVAEIHGAVQRVLAHNADLTLVEGAGGWRVPLSGQACLSDLARALKLPVLLVVGVRLGCINHALLSVEAIQRDGLSLAGWIGNTLDQQMARLDDNLAALNERIPAPCLGVLPRLARPEPVLLANHLYLSELLAGPGERMIR